MIWWVAVALAAPDRCHYTYTVWSATERRTVATVPVDHSRSAMTAAERGPFGCTPCEEDQVDLRLSDGHALQVCAAVAGPIRSAVEQALAHGAVITSILGYRPSMSRGDPDAAGNRTVLSNHAVGVALDVNEAHNGLYGGCATWSPACRLLKGGPWSPSDPLSIQRDGAWVQAFRAIGYGWGGELAGDQKDFMHFSPSGG